MKKHSYKIVVGVVLSLVVFSCTDFLDIVPDNIATIDNAFASRVEAERYLFTCYSYLPNEASVNANPAFYGGDESWIYWPLFTGPQAALSEYGPYIAHGFQNAQAPYFNYWDGENGGKALYRGIRDCNIFLENVDKVYDLDEGAKERWKGEVLFLKAYYHFYLFRMYGPIPVVDNNLPIDATIEEVRVARDPVDKTVDFIAALLDSAAVMLPLKINNQSEELGRITKPVALSIKARLLVTAASPLFNGNSDYADLKNSDDTPLFNSTYSSEKWTRAALACKEAIEVAESAGHALYYFTDIAAISDALKTEMNIRNAVCEKWNSEIIWGYTGGTLGIQLQTIPRLDPTKSVNERTLGQLAPTMKMAELFYSSNGVPITEDKTFDIGNVYNLRVATPANQDYIQNGYTTVGLHFDREPRFYANIAFDGSVWYMRNNTWNIQAKYGQNQSRRAGFGYSITGYFVKKLGNWKFEIGQSQDITYEEYSWPVVRLADLYLLYAEALNEAGGPSPEVFEYLNSVRARAGLESVEQSWTNFSNNPSKFTTQEGLRSIIRQERLIELAFEGSRFWDLRRWKTAQDEMTKPVYGWDILQTTSANYYRRKQLFIPGFVGPRDYLWPVKNYDIIVNRQLVQNEGW